MSDVDHTNALAAEYVLGTLDSEEREQARAMLDADTAFAGKVVQWERRLGELHLMVEPVEPDAQIWTRIKSKMPETQSRSNARLPEAHIPEPAPVAIPAAAPSSGCHPSRHIGDRRSPDVGGGRGAYIGGGIAGMGDGIARIGGGIARIGDNRSARVGGDRSVWIGAEQRAGIRAQREGNVGSGHGGSNADAGRGFSAGCGRSSRASRA